MVYPSFSTLAPELAFHALTHPRLSSRSATCHLGCNFHNQSVKINFSGWVEVNAKQIRSRIHFFLFKYVCWCKGEGRTGAGASGRQWGHLFPKLVRNAQECSDGQCQISGRAGDLIKWAGYTDSQCQPKSNRKHRRVHRSKINVF